MVTDRARRRNEVIAANIGNAMEWYDFLIFGYLTAIVSRLFFPTTDEYCALLATTATFGVGFVTRPIGGVLLGIYADRHGRKASLQLCITITTFAMALMAFAPTYAAFGIGAPLIIVFARLLQGFATGGEFASSTAFLIETAPAHKRGLYGSWQAFGQILAMILATSIGTLITANLSPEALSAWGWRVPLLLGLLIAPVGWWMRRHMHEPAVYLRAHRESPQQSPLREVLFHHPRALLVCSALTASGTISTYILTVYMPTFAHSFLGLPLHQAFASQLCMGAIMLPLVPFFGALSDRVGRKPVLITSLLLYAAILYPSFSWLIQHPSSSNLIVVLALTAFCRSGFGGVLASILAEQFPTATRSTGMSLSYNGAVMVFGGSAQLVVTWLIGVTGTPLAVAWYLIGASAVGIIAAFYVIEPSDGASPTAACPAAEQPSVPAVETLEAEVG